ncbi:4'-phosphopantetheinyl transferase family protein [Streptomyces tanashiensis]|uniref:4'-phosphopantetheinyl transferase superfamily protein n=1 Tax=Streptomyces tanashiensis TaxID=67367 RepID=A0ABY6QVU0_9ACTN|nr:4'-phosphopantetheinyl transferase superfamily protein [Streptomyces tanashiensis]UZX21123.1 4'-phosphopantetheinyl transferase superfamily protein [Streptomyces tanashiensis]GGY53884.1 4'-phosphopantetheinyl transferase [Streptomyces tanashiensis]
MIERILPAGLAVSEAFDDPADATLFPEEAAVVRNAVDSRRREFTTIRMCARRALAGLGLPPVPVLPGEGGAPRWPEAVVGSLTHCTGYRGAVLGRATEFAMIGIDAEPHAPLPEGILDATALPTERRHLRLLGAADPGVHWDRLLFCMKEAVFKAWYPFTGHALGFEDADISIDLAESTFDARILVPHTLGGGARLDRLEGRWLTGGGLALAAITVPVAQLPSTTAAP